MGFQEEEMPGQQPDPEFKAWFAGPWKQLTEAVEVPGMKYASWDRKAAYTAWRLADNDLDLSDPEALLRYIETGNVNAPNHTIAELNKAGGWVAPSTVIDATRQRIATSVGKTCNCANYLDCDGSCLHRVNHEETDACPDYPEGVVSGFDSAKW